MRRGMGIVSLMLVGVRRRFGDCFKLVGYNF